MSVEDDVMSPSTRVFSFPIASPEGAVTASDMGAMEELNCGRYIRIVV